MSDNQGGHQYTVSCANRTTKEHLASTLRPEQPILQPSSVGNGRPQNGESSKSQSVRKRKRSVSPGKENVKYSQVIISVQLRGDDLDIPA